MPLHTYIISFIPMLIENGTLSPNSTVEKNLQDIATYYNAIGPAAVRSFLSLTGKVDMMMVSYRADAVLTPTPTIVLSIVLSNPVDPYMLQMMVEMVPDVDMDGEVPMDKYNVVAMNATLKEFAGFLPSLM